MGMDIPNNPNKNRGEEKFKFMFFSGFVVLIDNKSAPVVKE